ncbi:hypothetical protein RO3G_09302 [Rhizopus delemar RA 99-880]|uniref:Uncharacterized protein n=1 Tax=Rhizopus delemar (strain RA 99-880 / ATCC MYA-4621 / FGSC 9543 / NRRL 43880) TaxID=246409 RepID=I1C812_RHIO9|nr:hypothetical protein RO3G_09302 [Rhizopus delemar RA 99-880]|eukprot:EIE84592.1 hypothetical protein RO3G_09302 [Rhizopus delemar RA 99-880]
MNFLTSIAVNPIGFYRIPSTENYAQIIRAWLEYVLVINRLTVYQIRTLEYYQNECLQRIYIKA